VRLKRCSGVKWSGGGGGPARCGHEEWGGSGVAIGQCGTHVRAVQRDQTQQRRPQAASGGAVGDLSEGEA
jgi:hypothetical protein